MRFIGHLAPPIGEVLFCLQTSSRSTASLEKGTVANSLSYLCSARVQRLYQWVGQIAYESHLALHCMPCRKGRAYLVLRPSFYSLT